MVDDIAQWLEAVPDGERSLAAAVIRFARETLEDADETVKWNNPCFVVAGSNCLYVSAQEGYVNLGFYEGARLDDPAGRLEGTGKAMRHVKVRSVDTLEDPSLTELVRAAEAHARG
ncbi:MAG: DUF1801 domain-containing protein [Halobacteriales archaeon]